MKPEKENPAAATVAAPKKKNGRILSFCFLLFFLCSLIFLVGTVTYQGIFAQADDNDNVQASAAGLQLYAPQIMIAGETYHGAVISNTPAFASNNAATFPFDLFTDDFVSFFGVNDIYDAKRVATPNNGRGSSSDSSGSGKTAYLAVNDMSSSIPTSATAPVIISSDIAVIPYGMNHGIFEIKAVRGGTVSMHASYEGKIATTTSTVYSPAASLRGLDLVLPGSKTQASEIMAVVMLKDGNGHPVKSATDTEIRVMSSNMISAPGTVQIPAGQTFVTFPVQVRGDGTISVISGGLESDSESIASEKDIVSVRLAVAPSVALAGGTAQYVVWLERDGRPFYPPQTIRGELQTSNTDAVRFTENPPPHKTDNGFGFVLRNGVAAGTLYVAAKGLEGGILDRDALSSRFAADVQTIGNYDNSFATITAVIPAYGVSSADVCIGAVGKSATSTDVLAPPLSGTHDNDNSNRGNSTSTDTVRFAEGAGQAAGASSTGGGCTNADGQNSAETFREYVKRVIYQNTVLSLVDDAASADSELPLSHIRHLQTQQNPPINHVKLWLYPNTTSRATLGIVGFYHLESDTQRTFLLDENTGSKIETESKYTLLTPVRIAENHHVAVSAEVGVGGVGKINGNMHDHTNVDMDSAASALSFQPIHVTQPSRHTNMYVFPIMAGHEGAYDISVTSEGATDTQTLNVVEPHRAHYKIQAVQLPVLPSTYDHNDEDSKKRQQQQQPLYMVTVTDGTGRILDVYDEFGTDRTIKAVFSDGREPQNAVINFAYNVGIIYGNITDATSVTFTLEGDPGASEPVTKTMTPAGVPVSINLDMPHTVHVGEIFPTAMHVTDMHGVPIQRITSTALPPAGSNFAYDAKTGFAMLTGGAADSTGQKTVSALHDVGGAATHSISGFLNKLDLAVIGAPERTVPTGESFEFQVTATSLATQKDAGTDNAARIKDPTTTELIDGKIIPSEGNSNDTDSPSGTKTTTRIPSHIAQSYEIINHDPDLWDYAQTEPGKFNITAKARGEHSITIRVDMQGYRHDTVTVPFDSKMSVPLIVRAVSADGATDIETEFKMQGLQQQQQQQQLPPPPPPPSHTDDSAREDAASDANRIASDVTFVTPHQSTLDQPARYTFVFPDKLERGYGLVDVVFEGGLLTTDDGTADTVEVRASDDVIIVSAVYENRVQVFVTGGIGTGTYRHGQTIHIQSEPTDVIPLILPSKIAYWEGAPGGGHAEPALQLVAERDLDIYAIYEPDFTRIMYAMMAGIMMACLVILRKFRARIMYAISEMLEYVREPKPAEEQVAEQASGYNSDSDDEHDDNDKYEQYDNEEATEQYNENKEAAR